MDLAKAFYLSFCIISLVISLSVSFYAWQQGNELGARTYGLVAFNQALWTAGYIMELLSPNLEGKIF